MQFLSFLIAVPLLAIGVPAAAQETIFVSGTGENVTPSIAGGDRYPVSDDGKGIADIADKMADPVMQDGIATAIEQVTSSMMRLPIGQLVAAIESARPGTVDRGLRRDATVGDLFGRDAENLPERLGDGSRQVAGMMDGFARAMANMMPEFEQIGRDVEETVRQAKTEARRR